jgi:glycosyltransferase involved in cell wall biosynthesis
VFPFRSFAVRQIGRFLERFQPDFISAHYGYPTAVWLSSVRPLPKFLATCHGKELTKEDWGYRSLYGIDALLAGALNRSAGAVAISTQARRLMEEIGVEPSTILDIPNGVDLARFQRDVDFDFRKELGIPRDALVVLSVGREHPQKDFGTGIKAFAEATSNMPQAYYVIVGRGTGTWRSLGNELQLQERLVLCEGLEGDALVGAYQQSDIFFMPSVWELMPLVLLEAMACGLPAVVTNVSGSQDIVQTGQNGVVVEPGRPTGMAVALRDVAADKALRERMGTASLARAEDYSWEHISRMYLDHA